MIDYISGNPFLLATTTTIALALAAFLAHFIVKRLLLKLIDRLVTRSPLIKKSRAKGFGITPRLADIVPALIISVGIKLVPGLPADLVAIIINVANAFIILSLALAASATLDLFEAVYRRRSDTSNASIRSYVQVAKIVTFVIAAILILATIMDRSPFILLSGLGAMAAVIILVFQDTLLSFVASIQISSTDMLRVGDWIEVPHANADGSVTEIALHTVKVQNFDKTITTIPIRKLVTDPFKNWRFMQESGGRRIKRSLFIDQTSIRFLTAKEKKALGKIKLLNTYLSEKEAEITTWNTQLGDHAEALANQRQLTNIGTFRAYVLNYLQNHPGVHHDMAIMARQLQPTAEGLPLEVYCFANTIVWAEFEGIQADIFDHLYSVISEFGLRPYQQPAGSDITQALQAIAARP